MKDSNIPIRTNRILNFFLISLLVILIRIWFLSIVQYDIFYKESRKPQRRHAVERVERGSIRDRFNLPLAVNTTQYNAAVCYADIRQIPRITWEKDEKGKKRRVMKRKEHIEMLSKFLAKTLEMNPQVVEDTIHGKACLFPHTPFVLKEDIAEDLYYQLKMEEKDWLGLQMQQTAKRVYPQGKVACDLIGYMGAIGQREYLKIAQELDELKQYLTDYEEGKAAPLPKGFANSQEVGQRYQLLKEKSYTINDQVGKSGVEATFDEQLRGQYGKKVYEIDINGNVLNELPEGIPGVPGERLILSLSVELQAEAEKLLSEYEFLQEERDKVGLKERRVPWQRGGAIVVMHPKTGEILALASYPRFDPNDFVPAQSIEKRKKQRSALIQWLENEAYIGEIWDGKRPMQREWFRNGDYFIDECPLTWEVYLDTVLSKKSVVRRSIESIETIAQVIDLPESEYLEAIPHTRDKMLFLDLLEMVVDKECFTPELLHHVGDQTLATLRLYCQTAARCLDPLKEFARQFFRENIFKQWRQTHFPEFLKERRRLEKAHHRYARPYTEYLEKEEFNMFADFWQKNRLDLLYAFIMEEESPLSLAAIRATITDPLLDELQELLFSMKKKERLAYLKALRTFEDLNHPLKGKYPQLRNANGEQLEKHLAAGFYPYTGFGYGRSQAFRQASPLGSIFKLVPAYAGLKAHYLKGAENLNPLTLIDDMQWVAKAGSNSQILGYFENGEPIKRLYKGGRLPRAYPKIGKIDVTKALERSSNIYFSILAGDVLDSPNDLLHAAMDFGMGRLTGIDLPDEYKGVLPDDILHNKTGLYSFAMGQHSLIVTPLQTALMLSAIANGGEILKPQIVKFTAGKHGEGFISFREPEVIEKMFLPDEIRSTLIKGMYQVTNAERGSARTSLMRAPFHDKDALGAYRKLHSQMIGKTGTAEILYKQTLDAESHADMEKHVWFGSISFEDKSLETPELVVVVYLRFGSVGRQGAPIAAALTQKWREIKAKH